MEAYKNWVRRNRDYVNSLESLANGLTWLLPERFSTSEIGPEAVTAILGIITAVNEHIIDTTPTQKHGGSAAAPLFPYSLCISALKDLETVVEVAAEQYYGDKKWNFIAVTETVKVIVRLASFRNSGYKMLLHGGQTVNVEEHYESSSSHQINGGLSAATWLQGNPGQNPWGVEGRALSALNTFGRNARMASTPVWMGRVQQQQAIITPPTPVADLPSLSTIIAEKGFNGALFVIGEVLFITRPLLYVLLIRRYGTRSWTPWFLSLGVDLLGVGFLSYVKKLGKTEGGKQFCLSAPESDELRRRKLLWALYLMREPFFSKYTRGKLEGTEKLMEPVPVIGTLAAKLVELIMGAQSRYTYMSGS